MGKTPLEIESRFKKVHEEAQHILDSAFTVAKTDLPEKISFEFVSSAPRDILTDFERAQSVFFITRYEALPTITNINIVEKDGKYFLANFPYVRYVLNEYRPIILNQKDSVYFGNIHKFCRQKLSNKDHSKDLSIKVHSIQGDDITDIFMKILDEKIKVIKRIIKHCEFDYIYNGILQHSDHRFTKRFLKDYISGEINYIFVKYAQLLEAIKELLVWHYKLINILTFPKMGSL